MTKDLLEQYPDICRELEDVERKLHQPVSDTVSGSGSEFPFTQHTFSIRGIQPELLTVKTRLQAQKEEIEAFIRGLPNSRLRRIVDYRVIQGMSWEQVAAKMGHRGSVWRVKHQYYRSFGEK
ncbi:MAG: hypothetical protein HFE92_01185 [Acutalibacter muris]|nr:hypothetical protein [Acutalibacter muris]